MYKEGRRISLIQRGIQDNQQILLWKRNFMWSWKVIKGSGTDTDVFLNTTNSLNNYVDYESNYSETINSYPKAKVQGYIYSYPQKYYAVYEQTKYDILLETGTRPETQNSVYFAKDLETAKEHKFTLLN